MILILASACRSTIFRTPIRMGGNVRGSVYVQVEKKTGEISTPASVQIYLPDLKVYLHNTDTGRDSPPVITDLFGRYAFPKQPAGRYSLRWDAQSGWSSGQHPDPIVIDNGTVYPVPAQVVAGRTNGVVYGRVRFADGDVCWYEAEFFSERHTAEITILNTTRTLTLSGPVHANVWGWYAAAGVSPRTDVTLRAQIEASSLTRIVPATSVSFAGSGTAVDVQLPNHKPEVLTVVPESAGSVVKTATAGSTIQLRALTRDADGDPLTYAWKVLPGEGSITGTGNSVQWTLPTDGGNHYVYLQVKDGRGGYAQHRIDFPVAQKDTIFSGRAVDKRTGAPVKDANVSVNGNKTTTAANGFFQVRAPLTKRYVFSITKTGYALFARVVDAGETGQMWRLVAAQEQVVDPSNPIIIVDQRPELERQHRKGVTVKVPAGALIDASGNKPTGPLKAYLATFDIEDGEAPGDWGALKEGKEANLISYGAGFLEFVDSSGTKFNLAPDTVGEVEFYPPPKMMPGAPAGTPMWSYDESDGYWKVSGEGMFRPASGTYVGKVKHFSAFNTDLALDQAACLKVLLYPPLTTGVKLRMTDPTGVNFAQTFDFVLDRPLRGIYRVPANINVRLQLFDAQNNEISNLVIEEVPGVPLPGNIVNSGPPIPAGQTLWPDEPYDTCKLVILRLDIATTADYFLALKETGSEAQAQGYYSVVDPPDPAAGFPQGRRTTLGDWWRANGFTIGPNGWPNDATSATPDADVVRTTYLNNNDLGSGRDMYFRNLHNGKLAAFVVNYGLFNQDAGNADLAAARITPGATVCMEYSSVENQDPNQLFVKFFVFAGNGGQANAVRRSSANLDGFGEKFVPNLCLNCHGGTYTSPSTPPSFADVTLGAPSGRARFRELDYSTYKFPAGRLDPNLDEKGRFMQQNQFIANAGSGCTSDGIRDLIAKWYLSGTTDQDNNGYTPAGWLGSPRTTLYQEVIKKSCRTCHVAFDNDNTQNGLNWTRYDQLTQRRGFGDFLRNFILCDDRHMPHAVITYRNFWLSSSPHQPGDLRNYTDGATWPALGDCPLPP
jgi:hypothetical protein